MSIKYTPPEMVAEIMGNRHADTGLQRRLQDFVGKDLPEGPYSAFEVNTVPAVRAEYLARPTAGDIDFTQTASDLGLDPWTVTYEDDVYTDVNEKKTNMFRPRLALPKDQMVKLKVVDLAKWTKGESIGAIPTKFDITLADWWRDLRRYVLERDDLAAMVDRTYDISTWYQRQASSNQSGEKGQSKAAGYYPSLMGLYVGRAALFCDFSAFPSFGYATAAFDYAAESLGVDPVIVEWQPAAGYPAAGDEQRLVQECEVDLTAEVELAGKSGQGVEGINDWLRRVVKCVSYQD